MGAPADHDCAWRDEALALRGTVGELRTTVGDLEGKLTAVMAAMEALERRVLGPKSENMPSPSAELAKDETDEDAEERRLLALQRRHEREALKQKLRAQKGPISSPRSSVSVPVKGRPCRPCSGRPN